jgi:hypothetical protein
MKAPSRETVAPRNTTLPKTVELNATIGTQIRNRTREMKLNARLSRISFIRGSAIEV